MMYAIAPTTKGSTSITSNTSIARAESSPSWVPLEELATASSNNSIEAAINVIQNIITMIFKF